MTSSAALLGTVALLALGTTGPAAAPTPTERMRDLADRYWEAYVERYPEIATYQGVAAAPHHRLIDNRPSAVADWREREDAWLDEVAALVPELDAGTPEWLLAATLREALEASVATRICRDELWSLSDTWPGWQQFLADWAAAQPVGTPEARRAALARFRSLPEFLEREVENLREGMELGYTAWRGTTRGVLAQIEALTSTPSDASPLLEPARRDGDEAFASSLARVVDEEVLPAMQRFQEFLEREYLPKARVELGVAAMPSGEACYAASMRAHATLELDPQEVHRLGLTEMERIDDEMRVIAERSFGTSDVPALLERLRTDPEYTYRSREDLIAHAAGAVERAKAAMPAWFGRLPSAGVVIEPHPAFREPTSDQYNRPPQDGSRPGVYLISTWEPTAKSRAGTESTVFHETIPGHHLQATIALERRDLHPVQSFLIYDGALRYNGAYGEGWGLYAERLADEMELYSSDLDRLGMLTSIAWRAARLVVDPGMHVLGWSRGRAIDYMLAHTTGSRAEIESEVDRYIAWPGQAVGYMVGALEIQRLRADAESRLGARFDVRRFHDRLLEDGNLPLSALRRKMELWVERRR